MSYSPVEIPPPPARCCGDDMVPIERLERVLWLWRRRVVTAWCCIVCERIAPPDEPRRQQLAGWQPQGLHSRPPSGQRPEPPDVRQGPRQARRRAPLCTRCAGAGAHPAAIHDIPVPRLPRARD